MCSSTAVPKTSDVHEFLRASDSQTSQMRLHLWSKAAVALEEVMTCQGPRVRMTARMQSWLACARGREKRSPLMLPCSRLTQRVARMLLRKWHPLGSCKDATAWDLLQTPRDATLGRLKSEGIKIVALALIHRLKPPILDVTKRTPSG